MNDSESDQRRRNSLREKDTLQTKGITGQINYVLRPTAPIRLWLLLAPRGVVLSRLPLSYGGRHYPG